MYEEESVKANLVKMSMAKTNNEITTILDDTIAIFPYKKHRDLHSTYLKWDDTLRLALSTNDKTEIRLLIDLFKTGYTAYLNTPEPNRATINTTIRTRLKPHREFLLDKEEKAHPSHTNPATLNKLNHISREAATELTH